MDLKFVLSHTLTQKKKRKKRKHTYKGIAFGKNQKETE
jgi:hypothetical protein